MNYKSCAEYLLIKPEAIEDYPFGPEAAVFKVQGKLFAILSEQDGVGRVNLKCEPREAEALRDIFEAVIPGYHMNKKHWNTVILDSTIPDFEIIRMMDNSYALVVKGLKISVRKGLEVRYSQAEIYGKKG